MLFALLGSMLEIILGLCLIVFTSSAHASRECTQGPDCPGIRAEISEIKALKEKRHEDVLEFGRESTQVKEDDQSLIRAQDEDRKLRAERKTELKPRRLSGRSRHSSKRKKRSRRRQQAELSQALRP